MNRNAALLLLLVTAAPLVKAFVSSSSSSSFQSTRSSSLSSMTAAQTDTTTTPTLLPIKVVNAMPEWLPADLHNHYYLLRHGQSTSNVQGIISSDRALAYTTTHGLTDQGVAQAQAAAAPLWNMVQSRAQPGDRVVFVASPFARAHQTAQACLDELVALQQQQQPSDDESEKIDIHPTVVLHDALVERNFGRLDGQELFTYAYVWPLDKFNVTHTAFDVESVAAVCHRMRACILDLEGQYHNNNNKDEDDNDNSSLANKDVGRRRRRRHHHIILTSHADVLQITQLYAAAAPNVGEFSSYRFFNGEARYMTVGSTADLPPPAPLPRPVRGTFIP